MVLSGFSRTFSDITCGDGSLSKSLQDNNQNCSVSGAFGISRTRPNSKTPTRTPTRSGISDDPCNSIKKTPNCSTNKMLTVHECDGDRFIPNRSSTNMSRARHVIQKCDSVPNDDAGYHQAVTESCEY
uniref:SJCHGC06368 protein n=1 Tax=Schistosoma japonicum TaxID=6182 RepID=Q5DC33_SCHJA|nr:SJCHGC06368 protein [Schistosoma japonicum]